MANTSIGKERLLEERVLFALLDQTSIEKREPVNQEEGTSQSRRANRSTGTPSRLANASTGSPFFAEKLYFFFVFLLLTLRQGL